MKKLEIVIASFLILVFTSTTAFAGGSGEIKGHVISGCQPVLGAEIVLINEDMNTIMAKTDSDGYYDFINLPYGKYLITAKINGKFYLNYKISQ